MKHLRDSFGTAVAGLWLAMMLLVPVFIAWPGGAVASAASDLPPTKASLRFSHKTHGEQRIRCERCHRVVEGAALPDDVPSGFAPLRPSRIVPGAPPPAVASPPAIPEPAADSPTFGRPPEKVCLTCHFAARQKSDCGLCHLGKPARTERDRERIGHGVTFSHTAHAAHDCIACHPLVEGWDSLDGSHCSTTMESCLVCHDGLRAKKNCTMCHSPTPRPADHVRNFERKHGTAYRTDPDRCRLCHTESSCVACHSRRPSDHTLAWVSRRHGLSAQTNPDKCAACHSDKSVCRRCHPDW
ncbi:MAG TPA: hypothetical protein VIV61_06840 [Candidatus Ozemobacteraceae bacterium]